MDTQLTHMATVVIRTVTTLMARRITDRLSTIAASMVHIIGGTAIASSFGGAIFSIKHLTTSVTGFDPVSAVEFDLGGLTTPKTKAVGCHRCRRR